MIPAGNLDRLITIERRVVTKDAFNADVETWVSIALEAGSPSVAKKIPAQVRDVLPGNAETVERGLALGKTLAVVRIRYRSDVTAEMRVTVHGITPRVLHIVSGPAELGRREGLEMLCQAYSS